ncbi:MAG: hypothetical protein M1840_005717 [Geoglossum simile]|nr:MAG: hypothetical protein M1840_005717 [Geoglossum simile]
MRRRLVKRARLLSFILLTASLLWVLFSLRVHTLITLLFENGSRDLIPVGELEVLEAEVASRRVGQVQRIPKIIHQTYRDEDVPERWRAAQAACMRLHGGWEYVFWTDATAREFIEEEYSWFLGTFDGYPYAIQRADVIRYFVLWHYGGIYIDLDESLQSFERNWYAPYITVMYTTGPLFLSVMWKEYMRRKLGREDNRVRVLGIEERGGPRLGYWESTGGSSWHRGDAKFILWVSLCGAAIYDKANFPPSSPITQLTPRTPDG